MSIMRLYTSTPNSKKICPCGTVKPSILNKKDLVIAKSMDLHHIQSATHKTKSFISYNEIKKLFTLCFKKIFEEANSQRHQS